MEKSASLSTCKRYRYVLTRRWASGRTMIFVMLNPSTADASEDDPTIRRCIGFAKREGCGRILVVNLFAFRSTDPKRLLSADNPVGPSNAHWLETELEDAHDRGYPIVCAWGAAPVACERAKEFQQSFWHLDLKCLGTTKSGAPKHPLYLPKNATIIPWPMFG